MALMDAISQRQYISTGQSTVAVPATSQGFAVQGNAQGGIGVGTPGTGFAMTLLVVLGGVLVAYAVTRRIQGA